MQEAFNSLRCSVKGHEGIPLTYICMSESYQGSERLFCTKCAVQHGHSKSYILLEELMQTDDFTVDNWPQDEAGRKMKNLIYWNQQGKAAQIIENLFANLIDEFTQKMNLLKEQLIESFEMQATNLGGDAGQADQFYQQAYGLRELKKKLYDYIQENLDKSEMESIIYQYLKDPERKKYAELAKHQSLKLIPKCKYYIDDVLFKELGKRNFIDQLETLRQAFTGGYSPIDWKFANSGLYQSNLLKELNPGITFQSKSGYGEEVILSDQEFSRGSHGFRLRFDEVSENYRCHVLIGLYDINKKKEEFQPYMCVMCCNHVECMIAKQKNTGKFEIHTGHMIDVHANFDTNSFSIKEIHSDFTEGHTWVNQSRKENNSLTREKRKKFFVFFSSCGHHKVSLVSSY